MRPTRVVLAVLTIAATAPPAVAQDPFEIQVYEYLTVPRGRWNLETHLNHVAQGERGSSGGVLASHGQTHLTFELTRGITSYFELAGYLAVARPAGGEPQFAAWRVRPRFRLPEGSFPLKFSLSTEVGFPQSDFEENRITLEVRPIIETSFGAVQIDLNPVVGKSLRGPDAAEMWDFEPGARIGYTVSPLIDLSLEYYGSTGPLNHVLPGDEQVHQFYPGADIQLTDAIVWNVGVGFGATNAGNTRVYKMRLGWLF